MTSVSFNLKCYIKKAFQLWKKNITNCSLCADEHIWLTSPVTYGYSEVPNTIFCIYTKENKRQEILSESVSNTAMQSLYCRILRDIADSFHTKFLCNSCWIMTSNPHSLQSLSNHHKDLQKDIMLEKMLSFHADKTQFRRKSSTIKYSTLSWPFLLHTSTLRPLCATFDRYYMVSI